MDRYELFNLMNLYETPKPDPMDNYWGEGDGGYQDKEDRRKKRLKVYDKIVTYNLLHRLHVSNEGTLKFDDIYIYYCQKRKVKIIGGKEYKYVDFDKFCKRFLKVKISDK